MIFILVTEKIYS